MGSRTAQHPSGYIATDRSGILRPVLFQFPDSLFCMDWCRHFLVSFWIVRAAGISHSHRPHCSMPLRQQFRPVPFGYSLIVPNGTMEVARLRQDSADGVYNGNAPLARTCVPGIATAFGEVRQIAPRKSGYGKCCIGRLTGKPEVSWNCAVMSIWPLPIGASESAILRCSRERIGSPKSDRKVLLERIMLVKEWDIWADFPETCGAAAGI